MSIASPRNQRKNMYISPLFTGLFQHGREFDANKSVYSITRRVTSTIHAGSEPEELLRFYRKPLQVEVDLGSLFIDRKKKYGQIRKYQQTRVDEVKRSLTANPPEEPLTVTAWQSPGT